MMKVNAFLSGQAGCLAVQTSKGYSLYRRGHTLSIDIAESDLKYVFLSCSDVEKLERVALEDAHKRFDTAYLRNKGLRFLLTLLDPHEDDEGLELIAERLETLLQDKRIWNFVLDRILSRVLPPGARIDRALSLATDRPTLKSFIMKLSASQVYVVNALARINEIDHALIHPMEKAEFLELLATSEVTAAIAKLLAGDIDLNAARFVALSRMSHVANYREIVDRWTETTERSSQKKLPFLPRPASDELVSRARHDRISEKSGNPIENVRTQQVAIINKLKVGDIETARRYCNDLIDQQLHEGASAFAVKSLTLLSQAAKEQDCLDLNLEWAFRATQLASTDGRAYGQLADAYLAQGFHHDAHVAFEKAAALGDVGYAKTGFARLLRAQGRLPEAKAAYLEAADFLSGSAEQKIAWAGVAEACRDVGHYSEALKYYDKALEADAFDPGYLNGRASILRDLGKFEESWNAYKLGLNMPGDKRVLRHGAASLLRHVGSIDRAKKSYLNLTAEYPDDVIIKLGQIDLLRDAGDFSQALEMCRALRDAHPVSPSVNSKLGLSLAGCELFPEALAVLHAGKAKFPYDVRFQSYIGDVYAVMGDDIMALTAYEEALKGFPYSGRLQRAKAKSLMRLQRFREAYPVYNHFIAQSSSDQEAINGVASMHIALRDAKQAKSFFNVKEPASKAQWRNVFLQVAMENEEGRFESCDNQIRWSLQNCRFYGESRLFKCATALSHIASGRPERVVNDLANDNHMMSHFMHFHAAAAMGRPATFSPPLEKLSQPLPEPMAALKESIITTYGLQGRRRSSNEQDAIRRHWDILVLNAA